MEYERYQEMLISRNPEKWADLPGEINIALEKAVKRLGSLGTGDFVESRLAVPSTHLLRASGKLLRPSLVFLGISYLGEDPNEFIDLGVAIELLHVSSLIHDDLIDQDARRRGLEAVHIKYGSEAAVLAGDALISKAIQMACKFGVGAVDFVSKAAMEMCAGEMLDFEYQRKSISPDLKTYLNIAKLKCASLTGASASIGAVSMGRKSFTDLYNFGSYLGMAFQIRDDVLEFASLNTEKHVDPNKLNANIVKGLLDHENLSKEDALDRAVHENNRYIELSLDALENTGNAGILKEYAEAVRLKF